MILTDYDTSLSREDNNEDIPDLEDCAKGVEQAQEMLENMLKYGTIDKPKEKI